MIGRGLPLGLMTGLLITGGAGFIGGRVAALALEAGHAVSVLDDLSTGQLERLDALEAAGVRAVRSARKVAAPFPALKPETVQLGSNILTDH